MQQTIRLFTVPPAGPGTNGNGTTVVAFRTGQDLDALLPSLRRLMEDAGR